jgi:hypothetical protein
VSSPLKPLPEIRSIGDDDESSSGVSAFLILVKDQKGIEIDEARFNNLYDALLFLVRTINNNLQAYKILCLGTEVNFILAKSPSNLTTSGFVWMEEVRSV